MTTRMGGLLDLVTACAIDYLAGVPISFECIHTPTPTISASTALKQSSASVLTGITRLVGPLQFVAMTRLAIVFTNACERTFPTHSGLSRFQSCSVPVRSRVVSRSTRVRLGFGEIPRTAHSGVGTQRATSRRTSGEEGGLRAAIRWPDFESVP